MSDSLAVLMPGFDGTTLPDWVRDLLERGLGGVCLFGMNVESPEQLRTLTAEIHAANPLAVIAIDEEGGDVSRLYQETGSPYPGNAVLGLLDDLDKTAAVGRQVGWELRDAGVDLALAPDVDVNANPLNPVIGVRSFGADADLVSRHGAAWVEGLQATGVAGCAKHFPGHGDTAQDSHLALPVVDADAPTLRARDLAPFAAAVAAGVRTVMTSHILVPTLDDVPATFSRTILEDLLRGELGFDGVIVTDALDMKGASGDRGIPAAAVDAIAAGADFLCIGTLNTREQMEEVAAELHAAVTSGRLPASRLAQAAERVRRLGREAAEARGGRIDAFEPGRIPGVGPTDLAGAIEVSEDAQRLLATRGDRPLAWLRIETEPNIAVGASPWGPFAAGIVPAATLTPQDPVEPWLAAAGDGIAVVVGKDLRRHPHTRSAVAAARARGDVIVVEMGWPAREPRLWDAATFGASRLMGEALALRMEQ